MRSVFSVVAVVLAACTHAPVPTATPVLHADEPHLADLRQLTFGGENAEAYWSFDGRQLVFQARGPAEGCDRIYRMSVDAPTPVAVSSGLGATTCAFFLPGDGEV